jgi:hypothetical protein
MRPEVEPRISSGLAAIRRKLRRNPRLNRAVQASRALVHVGPWRHAARAAIRLLRPPRAPIATAEGSLLPELDPGEICAALESEGMCVIGPLPASFVSDLRRITDALPPREYGRFHEANEEVRRLVSDEGLLAVVRAYFGAEPALLECNMVVGEAEEDSPTSVNGQLRFHFDYAGWHSLNLFVYLTDVEPDSGAHQIIPGTHRGKRLRHVTPPWLSDAEVAASFGDRIRTIAGPAGTLFFENTEAFHRRRPIRGRRVMLNVLWASHRGVLSRGRLTNPYATYLERQRRARPAEHEAIDGRPAPATSVAGAGGRA